MKRLIVNADDFGLTSGVNRGIIESHQHGVVTSSTLMACGNRFEGAVSLAKTVPSLSVGCHAVLLDGSPTLDPKKIPTLLQNGGVAKLRNSLMNFACASAAKRLNEGEIEAEISAQVRKLQSAGVRVSHLDSHKHTHMFPAVLRGMLRAAKSCGVPAIRNPFEPLVFARFAGWNRNFQLRLMNRFRTAFCKALTDANVRAPDGCIGVAATGGLTEQTFLQLIEHLPDGTWEFVSHPGYNDSELDAVTTRLRESREKELAILTSTSARDALDRAGIQLISFREL